MEARVLVDKNIYKIISQKKFHQLGEYLNG